jgi:GntR family transcriptional repressor for pyruvate dehydrogenase complex
MPQRIIDNSRLSRNGHIFGSLLSELQQRIRKGEWQPGSHLPSITHLAHSFGVSTGSVREALRSLQSLGMVRIEHGRGVIVISNQIDEDVQQLQSNLTIANVVSFAEARRLIEPELAALAAERGSDIELTEILQLAITMEQHVVAGLDFGESDTAFHHAIASAAHNPVLSQMMMSMHDLFLMSRQLTSKELGMTDRAVRYHRLIADAIQNRNASQARLLMLAHMNDAFGSVLAIEAQQQEQHS